MLGLLAPGDVDAAAHVLAESAVGAVDGGAPVEQPAEGSVGPAQTVFHLQGDTASNGVTRGGEAPLVVFGEHALGPAVAQLLDQRPAGERQPTGVDVGAVGVGTRHPDQDRDGVGQRADVVFGHRRVASVLVRLLSLMSPIHASPR
jgi:hypothetical protein